MNAGAKSTEIDLDQQMRVMPHDLSILAGAGFALVAVAKHILRLG